MQIQLIFDEIALKNQEAKEIRREYKDVLENMNEFEKTTEEIKKLREKKKKIEEIAQSRMGKRYEKLEEIKGELKVKKSMLTDQAMTDLTSGKSVVIKDQYENEYEPVWSVKFKKI